MTNTDDRSLYDVLRKVTELPDYMQDGATKSAIDKWREKNQLVDDVAAGRTSFGEALLPLVQENRRLGIFSRNGACSSAEFEKLAKETTEKFDGVLPLMCWRCGPRRPPTPQYLTDAIDGGWGIVWRTLKSNLTITALVVGIIWVCLSYLTGKQVFAWYWAAAVATGFGLFISSCQLLIGYPAFLSERRALAEQKTREARFLDDMLSLHT